MIEFILVVQYPESRNRNNGDTIPAQWVVVEDAPLIATCIESLRVRARNRTNDPGRIDGAKIYKRVLNRHTGYMTLFQVYEWSRGDSLTQRAVEDALARFGQQEAARLGRTVILATRMRCD